MLFCLIVAILATMLWLNVTITEIVNKSQSADNGIKYAKVKTALAAIMAVFWGIVIRYGGSL